MATNGIKFKDKMFTQKILNSGIDGINISIKGTTEEEYLCYTHQIGLYDVIEGYQNLKHFGFEPTISYVVTDSNIEKFNMFVKML